MSAGTLTNPLPRSTLPPQVSQAKTIPLYNSDATFICMIPWEFAARNEVYLKLVWSRKAVKRQRPSRLLRAILTSAPGFFRHVLEAGYGTESHRVSARFGMAVEQQISTGHVWALSGVRGSGGNTDRA